MAWPSRPCNGTPKAKAQFARAEAELGRPEVAATIELFDGEKRVPVQTFLSQQTLPGAVNDPFVVAVNDALPGLERLATRPRTCCWPWPAMARPARRSSAGSALRSLCR